jgi:beta-lactamase superfamily II metal-dependent hydrolase
LERLPVKTFYEVTNLNQNDKQQSIENTLRTKRGRYQTLSTGQQASAGTTRLELVNGDSGVWQFQILNQRWLWLEKLTITQQQQLINSGKLSDVDVLIWPGNSLVHQLIKVTKPELAIAASSNEIDAATVELLRSEGIEFHWTKQDGAITGNGEGKFFSVFSGEELSSGF